MTISIVFVGAVLGGIASTTMKRLSSRYVDNAHALVYQYIALIFFATVLNGGYTWYMDINFFPLLSLEQRGILLIVGLVGYLGIYLLFQAFDRISLGVALITANLATFFMYGLNIALFDTSEVLSLGKLLLGILFFLIVGLFLLEQDKDTTHQGLKINIAVIYALGTALCWTVYFSGNTYFVKNNRMNPIQSIFITETIVGLCAFLYFVLRYKSDSYRKIISTCTKKDIGWITLLGSSMILCTWCYYYGYQMLPSSLVNVIKLFNIIVAALTSRWWLGDRMTTREIILMCYAFVVLIAFVSM